MQQSVKDKLDNLTVHLPVRKYARGKMLLSAGSDPEAVFYLVSGQVRQYDISDQGDEIVVNIFKQDSFFPMTWAMNQTPNQFFYVADTPIELKRVPVEDVLTMLKSEPDVTFDLLRRLLSGASGMQRRMAHMMGGASHRRVLYELLVACKRFGTRHNDGSIELRITQVELARQAGLTRETVNKELRKLKQSGQITTAHNKIVVSDVRDIESLLGQEL